MLSQYDGIINGYQLAAPSGQNLTRYQLMVFALQYELGDIAIAVQMSSTFKNKKIDYETMANYLTKAEPFYTTNRAQQKLVGDLMGEHCSSFIKLTNQNQKLMASHDTWV